MDEKIVVAAQLLGSRARPQSRRAVSHRQKPADRNLGLRIGRGSRPAGLQDLEDRSPAKPGTLFQMRTIARGFSLQFGGGIDCGQKNLFGKHSRNREERASEELNVFWANFDPRLFLDLLCGAATQPLLSLVRALQQPGDDLFYLQMDLVVRNRHFLALAKVGRGTKVLPGQHLQLISVFSVDQDRDSVQKGSVHHVNPIVARSAAVSASILTKQAPDPQKSFVAARAGGQVLQDFDCDDL